MRGGLVASAWPVCVLVGGGVGRCFCLACAALGWLGFWPVPAHTRAGPWWLALGSWVFLGALTRAFLHDCCHSGSSRFLSLHYLLLFRPIPLLSIAGYWIAFAGCLDHLEVDIRREVAEVLAIIGAITIPASCARESHCFLQGIRAKADLDHSRSGSLLGLPTVVPRVTQGFDKPTGSARTVGGITLQPQRLR